jgi:TRAP-type mannitol/chloroaromatic compound transport system permease small subunit
MKSEAVVGLLENIVRKTGEWVSWLTLIMVIVMFGLVALRYWFDAGWIWLQESVTWMHAAVFMLGAAYTLAADEHVRVDIFYRDMSPTRKAWVNLVGTLIFLLPFSGFISWISWQYVELSWAIRESSPESGGLPYPWIPLMKSFIPAASLLLMLQGLVLLFRSVRTLRGGAS